MNPSHRGGQGFKSPLLRAGEGPVFNFKPAADLRHDFALQPDITATSPPPPRVPLPKLPGLSRESLLRADRNS